MEKYFQPKRSPNSPAPVKKSKKSRPGDIPLKDITFGEPFVIDWSSIQYYHEGSITENYLILPFNSMEISPVEAMPINLMKGGPPLNAIKYRAVLD